MINQNSSYARIAQDLEISSRQVSQRSIDLLASKPVLSAAIRAFFIERNIYYA